MNQPDAPASARRPASAFVISITPFTADGAVDHDIFRAHLRRMRAAGIGVYVGGGGSGEAFALTPAERTRLLDVAVEELSGHVPVRAMGVEPRTSAEMIEYITAATAAGVDASQIYSLDPGHGLRPSAAEIVHYLNDVLSSISIPCVISTHQSVGYQIPVPLLAELVETYPHIIGINNSHNDTAYLCDMVAAVGDRVDIHVGGEGGALTALAHGATGFLSSTANLAPNLAMAVIDAFNAHDLETCFAAFDVLDRCSPLLYAGGIALTKAVINEFGLQGGFPRFPRLPAPDGMAADVKSRLVDLGLLEFETWRGTPLATADSLASTP